MGKVAAKVAKVKKFDASSKRAFHIDDEEEIRNRLAGIVHTKPLKSISKFIDTEVANLMQVTAFKYTMGCFMEDGAFALNRSVKEIQGFSSNKKSGPSGDQPPQTIDVRFADGQHIKVPWGTIALPNLGEEAQITIGYNLDSRKLHVHGQCEKRFVRVMDEIMERAMKYVKYESIYAGAAIRLGADLQPQFIDLSSVDSTPLFLSKAAEFSLVPIKARLENPDVCHANGLPLKYGAILEGNYGTGKSLLAFKLAQTAIQNHWTFLYLTAPEKTADLLKIAGDLSFSGTGCFCFIEDIDLILKGERDSEMNAIFNIMDGGDTKHQNVISIFTTNHLENINPTFIRGKRIGSIITLGNLDTATAKNFIEGFFPQGVTGSLTPALALVEKLGIVPAFMAEILDRVKANLVYQNKEKPSATDIESSIESYKVQMDLAQVQSADPSPADKLASALTNVLNKDLRDEMETVNDRLQDIKEALG